MSFCIGYDSAIRYWLTKTGDEALPEEASSRLLSIAEARARDVARASLPIEPDSARPLHLVVPDRRLCHAMDGVTAHVWKTPLPNGALMRISGGNTIASPEFTFVQAAASRPMTSLIELGFYLCSSFSISDKGRDYTGRREPLTSVEELTAFVDSLPPRAYGARKARAALDHVVDCAASPIEVFLGMAYGLPPDLGGQEQLVMQANQIIAIDSHIQRLLGTDYLVGDIYLPKYNADLEYDSIEFHSGRYRLDHTQARRNALEAMGTKTISATYGQINTFDRFENFTWMLRERLGIEHKTPSREELQAQMALYDTLLSPKHTLF